MWLRSVQGRHNKTMNFDWNAAHIKILVIFMAKTRTIRKNLIGMKLIDRVNS